MQQMQNAPVMGQITQNQMMAQQGQMMQQGQMQQQAHLPQSQMLQQGGQPMMRMAPGMPQMSSKLNFGGGPTRFRYES